MHNLADNSPTPARRLAILTPPPASDPTEAAIARGWTYGYAQHARAEAAEREADDRDRTINLLHLSLAEATERLTRAELQRDIAIVGCLVLGLLLVLAWVRV